MGEGGVGFPWGGELQVVDMHVTENINAMTECKIHDQPAGHWKYREPAVVIRHVYCCAQH